MFDHLGRENPETNTIHPVQLLINLECSVRTLRRTEHTVLNTVIIGDDVWVFEYDPETKLQSS